VSRADWPVAETLPQRTKFEQPPATAQKMGNTPARDAPRSGEREGPGAARRDDNLDELWRDYGASAAAQTERDRAWG
jgi:hypothetical protein